MSTNYIDIEAVSGSPRNLVKQDLKFKTGKFVWRIKFTAPLNPATVNNMNLYVTTAAETPLKTLIRYDSVNNYIEIEPLEAYAKDESYILNISKKVQSKGGQTLKDDIQLRFKV
ncbi:Ig-like domain-containing protein [Clostridium sp. Marseille-P299]|uniref:Ig-like domain-containing protein n=1 Tax=Clostridium sp. Marseille-P299 TaxID=1805477 RepID=UPI00082B724C|nr:Ig-like domain-containing protein [Clostridium sp. Marseille-P299]